MAKEINGQIFFKEDIMLTYGARLISYGGVGKWFESGPSSKQNVSLSTLFINCITTTLI